MDGCVLVEGGTQAWIEAGLPVNRGQSRVLPLMRQVQITVGFLSAAGALLALTVNKFFALIPLVVGCGLLFAGVTGFCGLALVLAKMPWNQTSNLQRRLLLHDRIQMKTTQPNRIIIVGGVAGGASAAAKARRVDENAEIHVFERGRSFPLPTAGCPTTSRAKLRTGPSSSL